jgi:hypothetical protein
MKERKRAVIVMFGGEAAKHHNNRPFSFLI